MKILFLSRLYYPHVGGVEKHIFEISKRLINNGNTIIVVAEKHDRALQEKEILNGIEIYRIPVNGNDWLKKFKIWIWLWKNRELIKTSDIIHAHDVFFWFFPFRFIYPKKKVYVTFHGYESYPVSRKAVFIRGISEKFASGNICIGDFIKKWYGTNCNFVSYGGVNIPKTAKLPLRSKETAVFMGRLDDQTSILTYLEALKKIREKHPRFKLTVFGDGKYKERIKEVADFKGFVVDSQKELYKYNFVFASRYLSIMEGLAARRTVLAIYDNPLKKDYLSMSPFADYIVITNSANRIAEKVLSFLKYQSRSKDMIKDGFAWAKNQSWTKVADTYLELWSKNIS